MVSSKECFDKWGDPSTKNDEGKYMVLFTLPLEIVEAIPIIPKRIYCNELLVIPLSEALQNVVDRGLSDELVSWDGCFNIRKKRSLKSWSLHSWGIAIDINAATNGLGKIPKMSKELVKCFTDAGFDWGGEWSRPDGMHFQLKKI